MPASIIGGYAVAYHGRPRYTKDLDIWLEAGPPAHWDWLWAALRWAAASTGGNDLLPSYYALGHWDQSSLLGQLRHSILKSLVARRCL